VVRTGRAAPVSVGECMVGSGLSRSFRTGGVAVVALFAGLLMSPRTSQAACGDYVWIGGRHIEMVHSIPDGSNQDGPPDGSSDNAPAHGSRHRPCHGPGCSDGSFPPQAPAPVTRVSMDRWGLALVDTLPNLASCSNVLAEPLDIVTDGFRLSI